MNFEVLEPRALTFSELTAMLHQYENNQAVSAVIKRVLQRRLSEVDKVQADKTL